MGKSLETKKALVINWHPEAPYVGGSFKCQVESFKRHSGRFEWLIIDKEGSELQRLAKPNEKFYIYKIPSVIKKLTKYNYVLGRITEWAYLIPYLYFKSSMIVRREKPAVVYLPIAESIQLTFVANLLKRQFGVRLVGMLHQFRPTNNGDTTNEAKLNPPKTATYQLSQLAELLIVKVLKPGAVKRLKQFDQLLTISEAMADQLKPTFHNNSLEVIPYGFDPEPYDQVKVETKLYDAVFLGRLVRTKGIEDILQVWRHVVDRRPQAKLVIIGTGYSEYVQSIKNQIKKLKLSQNILLMGQKVGDEKIKLLKQSKSMLFLSHLESYSDVINEGMACNLPIVAYRLDAYLERAKTYPALFLYDHDQRDEVIEKTITLIAGDYNVPPHHLKFATWKDFAIREENLVFQGAV